MSLVLTIHQGLAIRNLSLFSRRWRYSSSLWLLLLELSHTSACTQEASSKVGGGVGLAPGVLGVPIGQVRGSSSGPLPEAHGWTSCLSPKDDRKKCIPSMLLIFFICLLSFSFLSAGPVTEVPPQKSRCCWRIMGLASWYHTSGTARKSLITFAFLLCGGRFVAFYLLLAGSLLLPPKPQLLAVLSWGGEATWSSPSLDSISRFIFIPRWRFARFSH